MRSLLLVCALSAGGFAADLTQATIVAPGPLSGPEKKAVGLLVRSVEERTRVTLPVRAQAGAGLSIVVRRGAGGPAEGYRIRTSGAGVEITGNDERGVLYGIGRLLRTLELRRDSIVLPGELNVESAPKYRLRGHQLGYRPKTNSYDGWDVAQWERYIGELAIFGANAIELIPPRSDDDGDSPHFPLPPMRMMIEMSRIIGEYGLECWVWYPAMDKDYGDAATVEKAVGEWAGVLRQLPRLDAVFVPGGDPGHTQPKLLMTLLEKQAASLRRIHPKMGLWMSPQGFNVPWMEEWFGLMEREPAWLTGVVFGPQVRMNVPELRARIPKRYPIRSYPDITHSLNAQYAVHGWDVAYAQTEEREVINPRPVDEAVIFRGLQPYADAGFLTYSEGCNDDVNKAVWSALGWAPEGDVRETLREYGRFFIGPEVAEAFAEGLLGLERNWRGALAANEGVERVRLLFAELERSAPPQRKANWRFQQALYRAYYDAYLRARLQAETLAERRALERLEEAGRVGSLTALTAAEGELKAESQAGAALRARVFELAEALFQSIRMQLSVGRYGAIDVGRGANLDLIDRPITNAPWLRARFAALRQKGGEAERLAGIREILDWTNPGPGGFYDDLGDPAQRPHLDPGQGFERDPGFFHSPRTGFGGRRDAAWRMSWRRHAETLYGELLRLRYEGLDKTARYKVRFVQAGDANARLTRLVANGKYEIHPFQKKNLTAERLEYEIPVEATAGGRLTLEWQAHPDEAGNGRFIQIAEVWLVRAR